MINGSVSSFLMPLIALGCLVCTPLALAQDWSSFSIPVSPGADQQWQLQESLSDEFNYANRDPGSDFYLKWQDTKPDNFFGPGAARIKGGVQGPYDLDGSGTLKLYATLIPEGDPDRAVNSTGSWAGTTRRVYMPHITSRVQAEDPTENLLKIGTYTEAMVKVGASPMSSNFWFISDTNNREIDVLEDYGDTPGSSPTDFRHPSTDVHLGPNMGNNDSNQRDHQAPPAAISPTSDHFIRFGAHWKSATEVDYYRNGVLTRQLDVTTLPNNQGRVLDEDVRLIFSLAPHAFRQENGMPWQQDVNGNPIVELILSRSEIEMQVDWVRTYNLVTTTDPQVINVIGDSTTSATVLGANANLGNGDYQSIASGTGGIPYADIPNWFHVDGDETVNHGQTDGTDPVFNPQAGATPHNYAAFQFNNRTNINDTAYTPAAGDVFSFGTYWIPFGGGIAATDTLTATLYTSSAPVDGDVTSADLTVIASTVLAVGDTTDFHTAPDFYTATGLEGPVYLGLQLTSGTDVFSRTDLVTLSVVPAASPVVLGDVNLDGVVNFLDISPFIAVLSAGGSQAEADVDQNGEVNFLDISPFIAILSSQ